MIKVYFRIVQQIHVYLRVNLGDCEINHAVCYNDLEDTSHGHMTCQNLIFIAQMKKTKVSTLLPLSLQFNLQLQ